MNIHPVGAKLFHVDRQDTIKLIVAFHNFVNAPKNEVQEQTNKQPTSWQPHMSE